MFKYGSFKLFLIKFSIGFIFTAFGLIYLGSLLSYDINDPGFKTFSTFETNLDIKNYFGIFGAYLSSYSIIIIGILAYLLSFFILIEGLKNLLGIKNFLLFFRFLSNILGIFFTSIFIFFYGADYINTGLVSVFLSDLLNQYIYQNINNYILVYLVNLIILIIGVLLIFFSFSIRLKYLNNFFRIFRIFKFLKYLNIIRPLLTFFEKKSEVKMAQTKNEPTIKKSILFNKKEPSVDKRKVFKQVEIDQFKFSLPERNLLIS